MMQEIELHVGQAVEAMANDGCTAVQSTLTMGNGKEYYFELRLLKKKCSTRECSNVPADRCCDCGADLCVLCGTNSHPEVSHHCDDEEHRG
jgi:hypothetical protein